VNDVDIKTLINSAVDAELDGHRAAPSWNPARLPERRHPAHPVARWSLPVLAASVAALLAAGTVVAIDHGQDRRSAPVANSATPTPSASPSRSTNPDLEAAQRAYAEAVAGAREATEVPGVSVGPLPTKDAARLKDTGLISGDVSSLAPPTPGKSYSFTLSYLAGPSDDPPAVLTTEVRDVASGSCAQPFLARPGHAYVIHCQAMLLSGVNGKATLTLRTSTDTTSGSMNLIDPAEHPASPSPFESIPPDQQEAARAYAEALASAPEASKVAGVSDRAATADELLQGGIVGTSDDSVFLPDPGRSYPMTLIYIPAWNAPATAVLAVRFEDVAAGRCPRPFRTHPGHAYLIRCQVTFRAGATGKAYFTETGPERSDTSGVGISIS
jgi:hypothetical protein